MEALKGKLNWHEKINPANDDRICSNTIMITIRSNCIHKS